jgi:hypothetical protein
MLLVAADAELFVCVVEASLYHEANITIRPETNTLRLSSDSNITGSSYPSVARISTTLPAQGRSVTETSWFFRFLCDVLHRFPGVPVAGQHALFTTRFAPLLLGTLLKLSVEPLEFIGGQTQH